jgi:aminotransferase
MLQGVQHLLNEQYDVKIPLSDILITSGVSGGIFCCLQYAKDRGCEKVALTNPFYTFHQKQIELIFGSEPEYINLDDEFEIDWDLMETVLKRGNVGALIFCNPANPTGKVYGSDDISRLVKLACENNVFLIFDEIYSDLVWVDKFSSPIINAPEHVVVCRGFSKNLGCQSWRTGFLVSSAKTVDSLQKFHTVAFLGAPFLQNAIGSFILNNYADYVLHIKKLSALMKANVRRIKKAFSMAFQWEPINPEGSMYVLFRHNELSDYEAVVKAIGKGVGISAGSMFFKGSVKNSGYIRVHVGLPEKQIDDLCNKILEVK